MKKFLAIFILTGLLSFIFYMCGDSSDDSPNTKTTTSIITSTSTSTNNPTTSSSAPDKTPPTQKVSSTSSDVSTGKVIITWKNPTEEDFDHVVIIRKEGSAPASMDDGKKVYTGSDEKYTDTDTLKETMYYYTIYVCDSSNNCMPTGETVKVNYVICPATPSAPTASDALHHDKIVITWTAVANANGYFVYRSTDNVSFSKLFTISISATTYDDTTAEKGKTYYYKISAEKSGCTESSLSASDSGYLLYVTSITLGGEQTIVKTVLNKIKSWGYNNLGQLGYGNTNSIGDNETPITVGFVDLGAGRSVKQVSLGDYHTCAILDNDMVKCWGRANYGQLGYGNTTTIGDDETPSSIGYVDLGTGRTAKQISCGGMYTCAILDNDEVKCWGNGSYGRLGYGNTNDIGDNETPDSVGYVNLGTGRTAKQISCGATHTCAILDNDEIKCWGRGGEGRLGYGNTNDIGDNETPDSVGYVNLGTGRTTKQISCGMAHTCAILDNDEVKCWGWGEYGRLGYGNINNIGDNETPSTVGYVNFGTGRTIKQISCGAAHNCAILDNDEVKCWGAVFEGRLGYGNTNDIGDDETPSTVGYVNFGTGRTVKQISCGPSHTCVILDNYEVKCWGHGGYGRLGYGNTTIIGDNETPDSVGYVSIF